MKRNLCLNSIVKNEAVRMVRMLDSVKDYISTFAILDTGSTDDTVAVIEKWGADNGIPGMVGRGHFIDFSQARNQALELARSWWKHPDSPEFSYLLLCDADMQLVVEDPACFDNLIMPAYEMVQKAGGMTYNNIRIVHVAPEFKYVGVTHEYLDCGGYTPLAGAHFLDHADGANRPDKHIRDIQLLRKDLETDHLNPRSWFYLANTYRDSGDTAQALAAYRKRLELGGWDEELWNTQINIANCVKAQGLEDAFVKEALTAYNMRPTRREPLLALANHFRVKGQNTLAMMFAREGVKIPRPNDRLFLEEWVYEEWPFLEEISIAGYYGTPEDKELAYKANCTLATSPKAPDNIRQHARRNMAFYLKPLSKLCPSAQLQKIDFQGNEGFTSMNPSICNRPYPTDQQMDGGVFRQGFEVLVRTVNYKISEHGHYMIGEKGCGDAPIVTENWLVQLDDQQQYKSHVKVEWDRPAAKFDMVIGLEDMRLFYRDGKRHFTACVRERSERGECEQWEGHLSDEGHVTFAYRISSGEHTEKNWIAWPLWNQTYVYRLDKLIDNHGAINKIQRDITVDNISGSSQWVPFWGGLLSVVHESLIHPTHGRRVYQHRFAWTSKDFTKLRVSEPFVFQAVQIEFCAGIARTAGGKFVMSFGVRDAEAWLCTVGSIEVQNMIWGPECVPGL